MKQNNILDLPSKVLLYCNIIKQYILHTYLIESYIKFISFTTEKSFFFQICMFLHTRLTSGR